MKDIVIFDFDGVILDSFQVAYNVLSVLHNKYQLPKLTEEILQQLFEGNIWKGYEDLGIEDVRMKDFKNDFKQLFNKEHKKLSFFIGIRECIIAISERFELMIISSNHSDTIKEMLKSEGLDNYFDKVFGAEILGTKREKIAAFILKNNIDPHKLFYVSDTTGDIREVEGLKIHSIAVSWGYHSAERLKNSKPDRIIHSPNELQFYLLKFSTPDSSIL